MGPSTGVLFVGRLFTTIMLVSVMFPALLTVPENIARPPGATGFAGQCLITEILGLVMPGQSLKSLAVTIRPKHWSAPRAFTVSRYGLKAPQAGRFRPACARLICQRTVRDSPGPDLSGWRDRK